MRNQKRGTQTVRNRLFGGSKLILDISPSYSRPCGNGDQKTDVAKATSVALAIRAHLPFFSFFSARFSFSVFSGFFFSCFF